MKKLNEYSEKELKSLRKCDLITLIDRNTTKIYRALQVMQKHELLTLLKIIKKEKTDRKS